MNKEYISGRDFYLLHIDIKKTLALKHSNRKVDGHVYLGSVYNKYIKTVSNSQVMIGQDMFHDFKEYIEKKDIKAITNELQNKDIHLDIKNNTKNKDVILDIKNEKIEMTNINQDNNIKKNNDDETTELIL